MSDLGPVLLVLAVQVTLPVIGGLLLSRRRDPAAACGPLVLAATAVLLLTPLAFAPRPSWPTNTVVRAPTNESMVADATSPSAAGAPGGINVLDLLRLAKSVPVRDERPALDPWRLVALIGVGFAGAGVVRITIGFISTWRVVRQSRPITESGLVALAEQLRQCFGCPRRVGLRESPRIGSAAMAGWIRPVVLLSPAWRLWSPAEQRAVLAHELAHVACGDFLNRLIAHLAVALHGYHPLVRWLAARLELRQELAADARAAVVCDGRTAYMRCLAGLALKADARPLGLSPTFLSRPRTLFRRIAMLRVMDDTASRKQRWPVVIVVVLAVGALGLHGAKPQAIAGPVVPANFTDKKELPPLDVSYVLPSKDENTCGVFAIRISEILKTPGIDKTAEAYAYVFKTAFDGKPPRFELKDVEQVSGRISLSYDPKKPSPNRSLMMSLSSIRMAKDFDWVAQLKDWTTDWQEHTHNGAKLYSAKITLTVLGYKDMPMWFYLPDPRTVVMESDENIKKLIEAKGKPAATPWADDWKAVANSTMAVVIPDVKGTVAKKLPEKPEGDITEAILKPMTTVFGKASRMTVGVDLSEGCEINVRFACASAEDAAVVDEGCQALAKIAEASFAGSEELKAPEQAGIRFTASLVRGIEFGKTVDHVVGVRMKTKMGIGELLNAAGGSK
jgi:beta-lactamase regulating signal transducer with metallopeptidase domain